MSEELFLQMLDFRNKYYYNHFRNEGKPAALVTAKCFNCGEPCWVNYMYGRQYPLCRSCAKIMLQ